jgi:ubiquinol-cytochrome c reductase cytochrome c subunit
MPRLRTIALVLLAGGGLLALVPSVFAVRGDGAVPLSPQAAPAATLDPVSIYLARCASCHGANGEGTTKAPTLIGVGAAAADFELRTGRMPFTAPQGVQAVRKPPAFDDATIRALVGYVASFGPGPQIPEPLVDRASVSRGQALFVGNCAPCHGATGNGGAVGGGALAPTLDLATGVQVAEAMLIGPGQMPVFSGLPTADRDAIVSYVAFLQTAPNPGGFSIGGIGPVPEGFVSWVLGLGLLMIVVVLVARDWRRSSR